LLFREGKEKTVELDKGGVILRAMESIMPYESDTIDLKKNDVLVLYTDGVTESMNPDNTEEYGEERLEACIKSHLNKDSQAIMDAVIEDIKAFSNDTQYDDITMLVIKVD
jgi:sigma-B regulation protein RsbU (phosphoserine phosphatase)